MNSTEDKRKNCIFLIGFMGSGKTTVGRELARQTGAAFLDTDEMIEQQEGISISEIFAARGEAHFRDLETGLLAGMELKPPVSPAVISVGGGLPVREVNREKMRRIGTTVFLTASEETLLKRLSGSLERPLLQGVDLRERIASLSAARLEKYLDAADYVVGTDEGTPEEIAAEIIRILRE